MCVCVCVCVCVCAVDGTLKSHYYYYCDHCKPTKQERTSPTTATFFHVLKKKKKFTELSVLAALPGVIIFHRSRSVAGFVTFCMSDLLRMRNVTPVSMKTKDPVAMQAFANNRRVMKLKCCFTSTETAGLLGTGAQDVHLDFHTAPELCREQRSE